MASAVPPTASVSAARVSRDVLAIDDAARRHIERVLALTHSRIESRRGVAAILKSNPHTLRARMLKLKIDWATYGGDEER